MRVGTRDGLGSKLLATKDHPHACGDKNILGSFKNSSRGSSPCVWGQGKSCKNLIPAIRIIPMRVGTSGLYTVVVTTKEDHPHACGDKLVTV